MQNLPLTDPQIQRFKPASATAAYHWDEAVRGFGLRVSPKGAKTFVVLIGGGRRQTLGRYPLLKLAEARAAAKRILAEKTLGSIRPTHMAYEDARDEFIAAADVRPATRAEYRRLLTKYFPFARKSVATITNREIMARLKDLKPGEKAHAFGAARAMFRYCLRNGYLDRNPFDRMQAPPASKPRERILSEEELTRTLKWALSDGSAYASIISLLILTGQRRGEVSGLERAWIGKDSITLPGRATKNGRTHVFPIGPMAQEVLRRQPELKDNPYVFPASKNRWKDRQATTFNGWNKPKAMLDATLGATGWQVHDLRRTFASGMASLQVPLPVIERFLNHISGSFAGIVGVYQRYDFMPEMRQAVLKWEAYLHSLLEPDRIGAAQG